MEQYPVTIGIEHQEKLSRLTTFSGFSWPYLTTYVYMVLASLQRCSFPFMVVDSIHHEIP